MRKRAFALFLALWLPSLALSAEVVLHDTPAAVYFSPRGGAEDAIVHRVDNATVSIFMLAYSFTSQPIAEALERAAHRGVRVEVILDRSQRAAKGGQGQALADAGAKVYVDGHHAIAHNKVIILDGKTLITGSFNYTNSAEDRNAENLLVLDSDELVRLYLDEWQKHRVHSAPW